MNGRLQDGLSAIDYRANWHLDGAVVIYIIGDGALAIRIPQLVGRAVQIGVRRAREERGERERRRSRENKGVGREVGASTIQPSRIRTGCVSVVRP